MVQTHKRLIIIKFSNKRRNMTSDLFFYIFEDMSKKEKGIFVKVITPSKFCSYIHNYNFLCAIR